MRPRVFVGAVLAALSVGVGLAASRSTQEPTHLPDPLAEEILLADRHGNELKCGGTLVKIRRSAVGGAIPTLRPEQAVQFQAKARRGGPMAPLVISPSFDAFMCEKNARGEETGQVLAQVTEPSGRVSTRTLENTNE